MKFGRADSQVAPAGGLSSVQIIRITDHRLETRAEISELNLVTGPSLLSSAS